MPNLVSNNVIDDFMDSVTKAEMRTALDLGALAILDTIGSAQITDGAITNEDINASAGIALSKLATDPLARANHTGTQDVSTITGLPAFGALATLSAVGSGQITDGAITNTDINASAGIALSKLATDPLARANHTGTQDVSTITGLPAFGALATLNAVGSGQITDGAITNEDINVSAGIALSKLATDPLARANHTGTQALSTLSQSSANSGEVPTWNGSAWVPAAPSAGGSTGIPAVKTANYTAVSGDVLDLDTTAGSFTVNLPASPAAGALVTFYNSTGSYSVNTLTVGRNGSTIDGTAADLTLRRPSRRIQFLFNGTTWAIYRSSVQVDVQVFTASGTYYKPTGALWYDALLIGPGGSGGSGRMSATSADSYGGGGGAGGALVTARGQASDLSSTEAVTVGTAGTPGAAKTASDTSGASGGTGTATAFGPWLAAAGSVGGGGGSASVGGGGSASATKSGAFPLFATALIAGGNGSLTTGSAGGSSLTNALPTGGGGGGGINSSNSVGPGAAGGAVGSSGSAINTAAAGGTAGSGGNGSSGNASLYLVGTGGGGGGAVLAGTSGAGGPGGGFGSGGGGGAAGRNGFSSGAGGLGAPGLVIVTTFCSY